MEKLLSITASIRRQNIKDNILSLAKSIIWHGTVLEHTGLSFIPYTTVVFNSSRSRTLLLNPLSGGLDSTELQG